MPRQAADEHFPRKERRFHQARRPAGRRRKRKRTRGDCRQRVTSGYYFCNPLCAVSRPRRQVSPHINQQSNNTRLFLPREEHILTRPEAGSFANITDTTRAMRVSSLDRRVRPPVLRSFFASGSTDRFINRPIEQPIVRPSLSHAL